MYVDKALEGYWLSNQRDLSPNTVRDYEVTFRRFQAFLGKKKQLEAITSDELNAFLNHH